MDERQFSDAELDAAVATLSEPGRLKEAEERVARVAPQLQRILGQALDQAGFFGEAHEFDVRRAVEAPEPERAVRTLLAQETRLGMLVGVAVGWELARELELDTD